jgi:hypothetical protein
MYKASRPRDVCPSAATPLPRTRTLLLPTYFPIVAIDPASAHHLPLPLPPSSAAAAPRNHPPPPFEYLPLLADATRARHLELSSQMSTIMHVASSPVRNPMFRRTRFPFIVILGYVPVRSSYPLCLRLLRSVSGSLSHLAHRDSPSNHAPAVAPRHPIHSLLFL